MTKLVSLSTVKARGWSAGLIAKLLGNPDDFATNPHYRSGPMMRLYDLARVEAAEADPAFQAHLETRPARRKSFLSVSRQLTRAAHSACTASPLAG